MLFYSAWMSENVIFLWAGVWECCFPLGGWLRMLFYSGWLTENVVFLWVVDWECYFTLGVWECCFPLGGWLRILFSSGWVSENVVFLWVGVWECCFPLGEKIVDDVANGDWGIPVFLEISGSDWCNCGAPLWLKMRSPTRWWWSATVWQLKHFLKLF